MGYSHCYAPERHPGGYYSSLCTREAPWWVLYPVMHPERHPGGYVTPYMPPWYPRWVSPPVYALPVHRREAPWWVIHHYMPPRGGPEGGGYTLLYASHRSPEGGLYPVICLPEESWGEIYLPICLPGWVGECIPPCICPPRYPFVGTPSLLPLYMRPSGAVPSPCVHLLGCQMCTFGRGVEEGWDLSEKGVKEAKRGGFDRKGGL